MIVWVKFFFLLCMWVFLFVCLFVCFVVLFLNNSKLYTFDLVETGLVPVKTDQISSGR